MSISRNEIAALCREYDRFAAELDDWNAQREADPIARDEYLRAEAASEPIGSSPMSETDDAGLIFKTVDNSAAPAAAAATAEGEHDWSGWEAWMAGHLAVEREHMLDSLAEAMMMLIHQERDAVDRKLAELRAENAELKGMIGIVLQLLTKGGGADVVSLPRKVGA